MREGRTTDAKKGTELDLTLSALEHRALTAAASSSSSSKMPGEEDGGYKKGYCMKTKGK